MKERASLILCKIKYDNQEGRNLRYPSREINEKKMRIILEGTERTILPCQVRQIDLSDTVLIWFARESQRDLRRCTIQCVQNARWNKSNASHLCGYNENEFSNKHWEKEHQNKHTKKLILKLLVNLFWNPQFGFQ